MLLNVPFLKDPVVAVVLFLILLAPMEIGLGQVAMNSLLGKSIPLYERFEVVDVIKDMQIENNLSNGFLALLAMIATIMIPIVGFLGLV